MKGSSYRDHSQSSGIPSSITSLVTPIPTIHEAIVQVLLIQRLTIQFQGASSLLHVSLVARVSCLSLSPNSVDAKFAELSA